MRFDTHAGRIRRGVPLFITWSPDEKHNVMMLRLSRTRKNDPANLVDDVSRSFGGRMQPDIEQDFVDMRIPVSDMIEWLPTSDQRRAMLARDGLASVEGFRLSILLVYEYVFGMRVCMDCPDCNSGPRTSDDIISCQDVFGSNAYAEGGGFGRADGAYTSIEAQKSAGSLHAHSQVHVQCVHQHTPLQEIMRNLGWKYSGIVQGYLRYKEHVCRQVYADLEGWSSRQRQREEDWPEYATSLELLSKRKYMSSDVDGADWLRKYLGEHVQTVQEMKQNHVHTLNSKGERVPLTHCQRPDDRTKCKSDFPRTLWLVSRAVVLCQGLLRRMKMPCAGRRNKLGSLHGPQNEENLNGSHPLLMAVTQSNSDVQLPYRFSIAPETHSDICKEDCINLAHDSVIIEAAQTAQDAQVGYACDYQNKRSARGCNEAKECMKGHRTLHEGIKTQRPAYIGKRHVTRLCSDAYGKSIVRSNQESINLRVHSKAFDVTAAESFHTSQTQVFPGRDLVAWREAVYSSTDYTALQCIHVDHRNASKKTALIKNVAFLYGHRPRHDAVWFLSPYEFCVYWTICLAEYPTDLELSSGPEYHATLTNQGREKLRRRARGEPPQMRPGDDYVIKEEPPAAADWLPFPKNQYTADYRHTWVLVRCHRPVDPTFICCPMPRRGPEEANRNAALIMNYFHPYTLNEALATEHVPFLGHLCGNHHSWEAALLHWFDGRVLTEERLTVYSSYSPRYK